MKVYTPEPIDKERAQTDMVYFAKQYLDTDITEAQGKLVKTMLDATELVINPRDSGRVTCARVAGAFMARQKVQVFVEKMIIDV